MPCEAQLSPTFYDDTCPTALTTIRTAVRTAVSRERRMAASLIRLHFHDCFVQGCDASILLDDSSSIQSEKNAPNNLNSVRGYEVIDNIKSKVESICPGVVSCADIVAVAARDASVAVSGPNMDSEAWKKRLHHFRPQLAATNLPSFRDSLDKLVSCSHTIGQARCVTFRDRVYNGTDIDAGFASTRRRRCPADNGNGDAILHPLSCGGSTDTIVNEYSKSPKTFRSDFASAMVKMGDIEPLTGSAGVIRKFCNVIN
ncbi:Lignin-forming anionic peroxidase [Vitis vinifera]|uniref:peroxidase n=1 Tax=Vitis vinifera TaxID=29760 RepID=A0A438EJI7_VITVI|nr:Lignin-forming anionic peroxidase [Vitis vinifera]